MTWTKIDYNDPSTLPKMGDRVLFVADNVQHAGILGGTGLMFWSSNSVFFSASRVALWQPLPALPGEEPALDPRTLKLLQVAVEAIRLVHGSELGDHYSHEPCGECGLGGAGAIRDALREALGTGYTRLVCGNDMNADLDALEAALQKAGAP